MKSFARLLADNSNVARKAINLHSLIGQQTYERMLTQMELMHNVVDLDRPISIQERANCRDINHTTRALPLRLPAIVLSRDSHRQHLPGQQSSRRRAAIARAMYLRDRNNITPDPTTRRRGRATTTGLHSLLEQCSSRCSTIGHIRLGETKIKSVGGSIKLDAFAPDINLSSSTSSSAFFLNCHKQRNTFFNKFR